MLYILSDPGLPGVRSMGPDVHPSVSPRPFADLTDVTLVDEDYNSISTGDANREILGKLAMQVALPGGQNCNEPKMRQLVAKFKTNASSPTI